MFMIMLHHLVVHNVVDYKAMEPGIFRFLLQFFFVSGDKVGVVIFFAISAWFWPMPPRASRRRCGASGCSRRRSCFTAPSSVLAAI